MSDNAKRTKLFDWAIVRPAIVDSFRKLSPRRQFRNPVMFVVLVGSVLTSLLFVQAIFGKGEAGALVYSGRFAVVVVYGPVCQFRRGNGRRARQGAGGQS